MGPNLGGHMHQLTWPEEPASASVTPDTTCQPAGNEPVQAAGDKNTGVSEQDGAVVQPDDMPEIVASESGAISDDDKSIVAAQVGQLVSPKEEPEECENANLLLVSSGLELGKLE